MVESKNSNQRMKTSLVCRGSKMHFQELENMKKEIEESIERFHRLREKLGLRIPVFVKVSDNVVRPTFSLDDYVLIMRNESITHSED